MTPFGEKIRALRQSRGINQLEMATALDVSPAYLSALEHGKRGKPSWAMLQKIIQYFSLIWDEAEELEELAAISKPKVTIDTTGLDPRATQAANLFSQRVGRLGDRELDQLLALLGDRPTRGQ